MSGGDATPAGLHVIFGSRTRRGLNHANEDRHAVAIWKAWHTDAHIRQVDSPETENLTEDQVPQPQVMAPLCIGSARKDTTVAGSGATGTIQDPFNPKTWEGSGTPRGDHRIGDEQHAFLWTVCDGHDGPEAANFVCKKVGESFSRIWHSPTLGNLPANLLHGRKVGPGEEGEIYARGYALSNALARTFELLDASFRGLVTDPRNQLEGCTAGSCVTSIFLTGNLMCCAGLGDCKAAILTLEEADTPLQGKGGEGDESRSSSKATQQFQVTWFSKEHRSSSPKEKARIRARGGWFRHGRVGGVLEPTRTIGDFDVKASQPPGVVIATPEVRTFSVTKPALVLIASDGVWDVMDASQLLRTLKKRRRLWRGILSWLGAPMPEKRSLMNFGFRRRAKSKEGLESMLQMPTGGDLCAMADTLVTRAHDLGSDDDCTCVCIYLRPAGPSRPADSSLKRGVEATPDDLDLTNVGEADQDFNVGQSNVPEDDDDDEEDDVEEDLDEEEDENDKEPPYSPSADSYSEYEKWRNPSLVDEEEANENEEDLEAQQAGLRDDDGVTWDLSTATFPVSLVATSQGMETLFPSSTVDAQDAPEVIEKARKRREERRAARERRKKSLEDRALLARQQAESIGADQPQQPSSAAPPPLPTPLPPPADQGGDHRYNAHDDYSQEDLKRADR